MFNVTLNGTRLQLAANASLGIANSLTLTAGTFDVTTSAPNAVEYTGGNQTITGTTYHTLVLAGTGTKSNTGSVTANGNIEIKGGVTFDAGSATHTIKGSWTNNGTFTAGTSNIQFTGSEDAQISGVNTFHQLAVSKSATTQMVSQLGSITAATVNMVAGEMRTGSNAITITSSRTGPGVILGTITRTHAFQANTAYAFASPFNVITFGTASNINTVTVTVTSGQVSNFPYGGSINRLYAISIPEGTYTNATLRLHYQDKELNGATESSMQLWAYSTSSNAWLLSEKTGNNTTDNWVEKTGLASITGQWTLSDDNVVMQWNGATSNDWHTASNWSAIQGVTTGRVPLDTDIVDIGGATFTSQPVIAANATIKSIQFGSAMSAELQLAGGNLTISGNINGSWSGNATHTLAVGNQTLVIGGGLSLSDGTVGHVINLTVGAGSISVAQTLIQSGNAAITFSGAGNLSIGDDYQYINGNFTASTGTITYNGSENQVVAGNITYHHLALLKAAGIATFQAPASVLGNLSLSKGGTLVSKGNLTVSGNVEIGAGTTFNGGADVHTLRGNWVNNGTFQPSSGTVLFSGTGNQKVSATIFNNLTVNKTAGMVTLDGSLVLNGNLAVEAGAMDLATFIIRRSAVGGTFVLGANTFLNLGGASNFPVNFNTNTLAVTSTVRYNCTTAQDVARVSYGNLMFQNGNPNSKTLTGSTTVKGSLTIENGATLNGGAYTLTVEGDLTNSGTFNAETGTVILAGSSKTLIGELKFNDITVTGSYTLSSGTFTVNNTFYNEGNLSAGTNTATFSGNFTNAGTIVSNGTTIFSGTKLQTIRLIGTITSTAAGITYFNGNVAPILNSNSAPNFVSVIINNTAGITSSIDWTVHGLFKVSNGASFHGGSSTHRFLGPFLNEGTVTSEGTLRFTPSASRTLSLGTAFNSTGTVHFGGSGQITLANSPGNFSTIEIANSNAAGITPPVSWNLAGTLSIVAGSQLNGGAGLNHVIKGDLTNDGVLQGNTSTFTFNPSASVIRGTGTTSFYHLVINDTTTILTNVYVKGDLVNNGVLTTQNSTVNFNGTSVQRIAGTAEASLYDVVISNSTATVSAETNLKVENELSI